MYKIYNIQNTKGNVPCKIVLDYNLIKIYLSIISLEYIFID